MVSSHESGISVFFHSTRFLILIITTACLSIIMANPLILNFTVLCMEDIVSDEERSANQTEEHWLHETTHRNLLFSATAIGNLIGTFPTTWLQHRFGTRWPFVLLGLASALTTAFFPFAVDTGLYSLIFAIRVFQGIPLALTLTAGGMVCVKWSPLTEFGLYGCILSMHMQFASIFTMPLAGSFCASSLGWRVVFYLQAAVTCVLIALFCVFYENDPSTHRNVSSKELSRIRLGKENEAKGGSVPYMAICTDPTILGVWVSCFGASLGFYIFLQFGPIYLNSVLHFSVTSTGNAAALPYILSAILKALTGPIYNHTTCFSEKGKIIFFACISQGFMAAGYLIIAYTNEVLIAQVSYTAVIVFSGLSILGANQCAQLYSRQYVPFVLSVNTAIICINTLVIPPVIAAVTSANTPDQWALVFKCAAVIILVTNGLFLVVAKDEAAPWTKSDFKKNKTGSTVAPQEGIAPIESSI